MLLIGLSGLEQVIHVTMTKMVIFLCLAKTDQIAQVSARTHQSDDYFILFVLSAWLVTESRQPLLYLLLRNKL